MLPAHDRYCQATWKIRVCHIVHLMIDGRPPDTTIDKEPADCSEHRRDLRELPSRDAHNQGGLVSYVLETRQDSQREIPHDCSAQEIITRAFISHSYRYRVVSLKEGMFHTTKIWSRVEMT
jgi:hypothetical protein